MGYLHTHVNTNKFSNTIETMMQVSCTTIWYIQYDTHVYKTSMHAHCTYQLCTTLKPVLSTKSWNSTCHQSALDWAVTDHFWFYGAKWIARFVCTPCPHKVSQRLFCYNFKNVHKFPSNLAFSYSNQCWMVWVKKPLHLMCVHTVPCNAMRDKICDKIV